MGLLFGMMASITCLITGITVNKKPVVEPEPTKLPPLKAIISTFQNKPFVKYTIIQALISIAFTFVTTMMTYYVIYVLNMESLMMIVMATMLVVLTFFIPPCKKVADHIGKAKTYALGLGIASVGMLGAFFLPQTAGFLVFAVAVIAGIGFSSQWVCPHSMMPDVIEYDELATGERREGIYYGVNTMVGKIANALGSAMCGWGLALFRYVQPIGGVNQLQSDLSLFGIRFMFALLPTLILIACIPLLIRYPISSASHAKVVAELAARRAQKG
jgi:GPH family glycoside/pentoside/hexuronide:cation symporter